MTTTKSQRGEVTEGWNDCPALVRSKDTPTTRRRAYRVASHSSREGSTTDLSATLKSNNASREVLTEPVVDVAESSIVEVESDFSDLMAKPSKLSTKELDFYINKVRKQLPLLGSSHISFIHQIITNPTNSKDRIVNYMLVNDGVASWCVPLKKLVESLV